MAHIAPFRAARYTSEAGPLEDLVAPPYDVISPEEQQRLCALSPHNVVRLILHPEQPDDDAGHSRYTRAAACLEQWLAEGVLAIEPGPALYVYDHEFQFGGQRLCRRGLLSVVKLEELGTGSIYPHEDTFAGPKADRLRLMSACQGCLSPIFSVYPDGDGAVASALAEVAVAASGPPAALVHAGDGLHRLQPVTDAGAIARLQEMMAPKPLFIADGHHRYETAWSYRSRRIEERGEAGGADYVLMLNVSMSDPGLLILPTHRVLRNVDGLDKDRFGAACQALFDVQEVPCPVGDLRIGRHQFIVYFGCGRGCLSLRLKDEALALCEPGLSRAWHLLDVSILRNLIFGKILGLDPDSFAQGDDIAYVHDGAEAEALVDASGWDAAFLLDPTRIEEVRHIASVGERMPPKSTYFYPKILSGLALYLFDDRSQR